MVCLYLLLLLFWSISATDCPNEDPIEEATSCGCSEGTGRSSVELNSDLKGLSVFSALSTLSPTRLGPFVITPLLPIPGGKFTMGTDAPFIPQDGEHPAREVIVSSFLLEKFEVSNRQFAEFVKDTGYITDAEKYGWSFCFEPTLSSEVLETVESVVQAVPWWVSSLL